MIKIVLLIVEFGFGLTASQGDIGLWPGALLVVKCTCPVTRYTQLHTNSQASIIYEKMVHDLTHTNA